MSFINSVLSSIGAERSKPADSQDSQTSRLQNARGSSSVSSTLKRKAASPVDNSTYKVPRKENAIATASSDRPPLAINRPLLASSVEVNSQTFSQRSQPSPKKQSGQIKSTSQSAATEDTTSGKLTSKPPPKNSYREILARAQAVKAAQAHVGQIKHKPVVKVSKKEKFAQEAEAARQSKLVKNKNQKLSTQSKINNERAKGTEGGMLKEKRKPLDLGYKGTMRSNISASNSKAPHRSAETPRSSTKVSTTREGERNFTGSRYRHVNYSDEEDEEEEEYESDMSEDMEAAGFDELEEEEEASLKYAKKEDQLALKEENEHKKQKEERRRKLQQLAAATARRR